MTGDGGYIIAEVTVTVSWLNVGLPLATTSVGTWRTVAV